MASLKIRDQTSGGWVEVGGGGGAEEVVIGPEEPTEGEEIWIDTSSWGSNVGLPTGVIVPFAASNPPAGWLLCGGFAVSRTVYADLFAVIGTLYGAGNGTTTFNLPNIAGRVLVNRDVAQTEFKTIGSTGGSRTHTLTVAEMPSHNHALMGGSTAAANFAGSGGLQGAQATQATSILHTGGGGAHNNLQPYFVVGAYIIKT